MDFAARNPVAALRAADCSETPKGRNTEAPGAKRRGRSLSGGGEDGGDGAIEAIGEGSEEFHFFGGDFAVGHDDLGGGVEDVAFVEGGDFLECLDGIFHFTQAAAVLGTPAQCVFGEIDGGGSGGEGLLGGLGVGGCEVGKH